MGGPAGADGVSVAAARNTLVGLQLDQRDFEAGHHAMRRISHGVRQGQVVMTRFDGSYPHAMLALPGLRMARKLTRRGQIVKCPLLTIAAALVRLRAYSSETTA